MQRYGRLSMSDDGEHSEEPEESDDAEESLTPTPAAEWRRSQPSPYTWSLGDMPGLQAFFRELNRSLTQQFAASEVFARVAQQQREHIVRLFASSAAMANFNNQVESMAEQIARAAMPTESYRRLVAVLVANMPRDLVIEVPTIDSRSEVGQPAVVVESGRRELMGVRLDVMSIGLIVFWVYFLHSAIGSLADGDVPGFKNYLGVAIGCLYALYEHNEHSKKS